MIILGLHVDMDACVVLVRDGQVVAAAQEERFSRTKLHEGFPHKALAWILADAGISLAEVDHFAFGWFSGCSAGPMLPNILRRVSAACPQKETLDIICERFQREFAKDSALTRLGLQPLAQMGVERRHVRSFEHHFSHAWSAFATSPFESSLVITADGRGDFKSIAAYQADEGGLKCLDWYSTLDSIGHLYSQVTHFLGFKANRDEGKVTGLAAYGDARPALPLMQSLIDWRNGRIVANIGSSYLPYDTEIPPALVRQFGLFSQPDLAAAVQTHIENLLTRYVTDVLARNPQKHLCLAGGVFANVKLNQRIRELSGIDNLYVQPIMNDAGTALGAAAAAYFEETGVHKIKMEHVYLGPEYSNAEAKAEIDSFPELHCDRPPDLEGAVAHLLASKQVVGILRGKMEFGPRALGNRSILVHASDASVKETLNRRLKRTQFMPFAPATMIDHAQESFVGWSENHKCADFMTMAYSVTPAFAKANPAVTHIDNTTRPQVVRPDCAPFLYSVLGRYAAKVGAKAIINTSFNVHEEPIVCTPRDGLCALRDGVVDYLVLNDQIVSTRA